MNILVLESLNPYSPWVIETSKGLKKINKENNYSINYYTITFDYVRLGKTLTAQEWNKFIKKKYKNIKFHGVFINARHASEVLKSLGNDFMPNIPKVFNENTFLTKSDYIQDLSFNRTKSVNKTIDLMLQLHPKNKKIYIIKGNYLESFNIESLLENRLKENPNIHFEIIDNFSFEELKAKVKNFEKNSIAFFTIITKDKNNTPIVPRHLLKELIQINPNIPFYSIVSSFLNTGLVGGYLIDGENNAQAAIESIIAYNKEDKFSYKTKFMNYYVDWKASKKYQIDMKNLPKNTIILNKPPSILEEFFKEVVISIIFIIFLISFILILLRLLFKLKETNSKLKIETQKKIENQKIINLQTRHALMGEMINNIAHQWRQPLNRINSNVAVINLLLEKKVDLPKVVSKLSNIEKQTNYMSETIDDFSMFLSPNKLKNKFALSSCIKKVENLLNTKIKDISIKLDLDDNIALFTYEKELSQVIMSILNNAIENFQIKNTKKAQIKISSRQDESFIYIEIEDNGRGIKEDIINKIFNIHFTTKKEKKSQGLGLYITKNIVENSLNGQIKVRNSEEGAVFTLTLKKENFIE